MKRVFISILSIIVTIGVATGIYYYFDYDIRWCVLLWFPVGTSLLGIVLGYAYFIGLTKAHIRIQIKDFLLCFVLALIVFAGISFVKFEFAVHNNNEELVKYNEVGYKNYMKDKLENTKFVVYNKKKFQRKSVITYIEKISHKIVFIIYNFLGMFLTAILIGTTYKSQSKYCERCNMFMKDIFLVYIPIEESEDFLIKLDNILLVNGLTIAFELQDIFDEYKNGKENLTINDPRVEVSITYCSNCNRYELDMKRYIYPKNVMLKKLFAFSGQQTVIWDKKYKYNKIVPYDTIREILDKEVRDKIQNIS